MMLNQWVRRGLVQVLRFARRMTTGPTKKFDVKEDYYRALGVKQKAGLKEIKEAHTKLVMLYHPDNKESMFA